MSNELHHLSQLPNSALLQKLRLLNQRNCQLTATILAYLGEVDARRLYRDEACSSMHTFCTSSLHLCDGASYKRIAAARAARKFPRLLELVADGRLHLTGIGLLAPHLSGENAQELMAAATHKSKRDIEQLIAARAPKPDAPKRITKLPKPRLPQKSQESAAAALPGAGAATALGTAPGTIKDAGREATAGTTPAATQAGGPPRPLTFELTAQPSTTPARQPKVIPLSADRFKVQFTASTSLEGKIRQAQDLLRHQIPNGDLEKIFEKAIDALLVEVNKKRFGLGCTPRCGRPNDAAERKTPAPHQAQQRAGAQAEPQENALVETLAGTQAQAEPLADSLSGENQAVPSPAKCRSARGGTTRWSPVHVCW
jgi:hypothetical protein